MFAQLFRFAKMLRFRKLSPLYKQKNAKASLAAELLEDRTVPTGLV